MSRGFITPAEEGIRLRISPGAKRTSIEGPCSEDVIRLKVAAPPVSGKAEVERLGIPRSAVTRGASSRDKAVALPGPEQTQTNQLLSPYLR